MSLLPDTGELYAIAERISTHADHARVRAARLRRHVQHLQWRGPAANAFTPLAAEVERGLYDAAARLDTAAAQLRSHAHTVDDTADRLRALAVGVGTDVVAVGQAGMATAEFMADTAGDALGSVLRGGSGLVGNLLGIGS